MSAACNDIIINTVPYYLDTLGDTKNICKDSAHCCGESGCVCCGAGSEGYKNDDGGRSFRYK